VLRVTNKTQMGAGYSEISTPKAAMEQRRHELQSRGRIESTRGQLRFNVLDAICVWRGVVCLTERNRETHTGAQSGTKKTKADGS
jgi:hypothetical protein